MTLPDPTPEMATSAAPAQHNLEQSFRSLQKLFFGVVISLLPLSGGLCLFLLREVKVVRLQVDELSQSIASFEKNNVPLMVEFRTKLQEFAKTHPDFKPILGRYVNPTNVSDAVPGNIPAVRMPTIPGGE